MSICLFKLIIEPHVTQFIDRTPPGPPESSLLHMAEVSCRFSLRSETLLMSNADGASAGKCGLGSVANGYTLDLCTALHTCLPNSLI